MKANLIFLTILLLFSFYMSKKLKTKQACVRLDLTLLTQYDST